MSTEGVNATLTSYSLVELSEKDQIEKMEELIKVLDKPDTLSKFVEACKNIGQTALEIDTDFIWVKDGFDDLVKNYGKDFPELAWKYVPDWARLMAVSEYSSSCCSWIILACSSVGLGKRGFSALQRNLQPRLQLHWLVRCSPVFSLNAAQTDRLTLYSLRWTPSARCGDPRRKGSERCTSQTPELRCNYATFSFYYWVSVFWWITWMFSQDTHWIEVGTEVADGFKDFRNDIERFSKHFTQYLVDEGKRLTKGVEGYEKDIKTHQAQIDRFIYRGSCSVVALEFLNSLLQHHRESAFFTPHLEDFHWFKTWIDQESTHIFKLHCCLWGMYG